MHIYTLASVVMISVTHRVRPGADCGTTYVGIEAGQFPKLLPNSLEEALNAPDSVAADSDGQLMISSLPCRSMS